MSLDNFIGTGILAMNVKDTPAPVVLSAIRDANIPEKLLRSIKSSDAFKRAMRDLVKKGIIRDENDGILRDKVEDTTAIIAFQFTPKFLKDKGVTYDSERSLRVEYVKEREDIVCDNEQVLKLARDLFFDAKATYPSSKINDIARMYCESRFTRLSYRDGVYFVPKDHSDVVDNLKVFYTKVGAGFQRFAVGQFPEDRENIARAIVEDIKQKVITLKNEIEELKHKKQEQSNGEMMEENKLTKRVAQNRLKDLKEQLERYRELARTVDAKAEEIFKEAGEAGCVIESVEFGAEGLVALALQGQSVNPTVLELAAVATGRDLPSMAFSGDVSMPEVKKSTNAPTNFSIGENEISIPGTERE